MTVTLSEQISSIRKGEKFTDFIERLRGEDYKKEFYDMSNTNMTKEVYSWVE